MKSTSEVLGITKNGFKVIYDPKYSHAATHLEADEGLHDLVKSIIVKNSFEGESIYKSFDMGSIVGKTDLVKVNSSDDVFYAKRKNRNIYTKFVRSREPVPTSEVTVVLRRKGEHYVLTSCWIGQSSPMFPGDSKETSDSVGFWENHALVEGRQEYDPSTVRIDCPWG